MEAIEEVCIALFIRKLLYETEGVAHLKKVPIIEHSIIFVLYMCLG